MLHSRWFVEGALVPMKISLAAFSCLTLVACSTGPTQSVPYGIAGGLAGGGAGAAIGAAIDSSDSVAVGAGVGVVVGALAGVAAAELHDRAVITDTNELIVARELEIQQQREENAALASELFREGRSFVPNREQRIYSFPGTTIGWQYR